MATLRREVRDGQGNLTVLTTQLTVESLRTMFGKQFSSGMGAFPTGTTVPIARIYFEPGDFAGANQPTWANKTTITQAIARGATTFVISMKDATPAAITKWLVFLNSIPHAYRESVFLSYMHEHEAKFRKGTITYPVWKANFDAVRVPSQAAGFKFGPIHNGLNSNAQGQWVWGVYYEPADMDACDWKGIDCYDASNKGAYKQFFSPTGWFEYFASFGKPIIICETAAPTGPTQSDFANEMRSECEARPEILGVCWWDEVGSTADWRLTDASRQAWFA